MPIASVGSSDNKKMKEKIEQIVKRELISPTLEMTKQILAVLDFELVEDLFSIERIDIDDEKKEVSAYVDIRKTDFYLDFTFNTLDSINLYSVNTKPFIEISYFPTSETLTVDELQKLTKIKPHRKIHKGESFGNGKFQYNYNGLEYLSAKGPGNITFKINSLLELLETDLIGIKELSNQTNCSNLLVTISYHVGNGNFTELWLEKEIINRLAKFDFDITFDIYAEGTKLKDE